jgi:hypothetical protein
MAVVRRPRSFSQTTPAWLTTKVLTPLTPYSTGYATSANVELLGRERPHLGGDSRWRWRRRLERVGEPARRQHEHGAEERHRPEDDRAEIVSHERRVSNVTGNNTRGWPNLATPLGDRPRKELRHGPQGHAH